MRVDWGQGGLDRVGSQQTKHTFDHIDGACRDSHVLLLPLKTSPPVIAICF